MSLPVVLFALKASHVFFGVLMSLTAVFLILLILVQRGKGGGLAGAFGGMGGQSAFGTKAGDTFTRVTIVAATFWILLCVASVKILSAPAWAGTGSSADSGEDADGPTIGSGASDSESTADDSAASGMGGGDAGSGDSGGAAEDAAGSTDSTD